MAFTRAKMIALREQREAIAEARHLSGEMTNGGEVLDVPRPTGSDFQNGRMKLDSKDQIDLFPDFDKNTDWNEIFADSMSVQVLAYRRFVAKYYEDPENAASLDQLDAAGKHAAVAAALLVKAAAAGFYRPNPLSQDTVTVQFEEAKPPEGDNDHKAAGTSESAN